MSSHLKVGDCVETKQGVGLIKYIGTLHGRHHSNKQYIGIELLQATPNGHDGTIDGDRYFYAQMGHGMRIFIHQIIRKLSVAELFKTLQDITLQYAEATKFFTSKIMSIQSALIQPVPTPLFNNKLQSPSITATFTYNDIDLDETYTTEYTDSESESSSDASFEPIWSTLVSLSDDSDLDSVKRSSFSTVVIDDTDDEEDNSKDICIPLFLSRPRAYAYSHVQGITKSSNLPKYPLRPKLHLVQSPSLTFLDCTIEKPPKYIQQKQKEHRRASSLYKYKSRRDVNLIKNDNIRLKMANGIRKWSVNRY